MSIRKIMRMGHPVLRQPARPMVASELRTPGFEQLLRDMVDTLHEYGGIGLAAPQINESLRLAIVELPGGHSRYGELPRIPLTVFVNPRIEVLDDTVAGYWEGCLSVPGLRGWVERPQHVRVDYLDREGAAASLELQGFAATVAQHEFDHLDGRLYVDRISDTSRLAFEEEYVRYHAPSD